MSELFKKSAIEIIMVMFSFVIGIVVIGYVIKHVFKKFKFKDKEFIVNDDGDIVQPHSCATCSFAKNLISSITIMADATKNICHILFKEIMERQMLYCHHRMQTAAKKLNDIFKNELSNKIDVSPSRHVDYLLFKSLSDLLIERVLLVYLRDAIKNNGIPDPEYDHNGNFIDKGEFKRYLDSHYKDLFTNVFNFFEDNYEGSSIINMEILKQILETWKPDFYQVLRDILVEVKKRSKEKIDKALLIEKKCMDDIKVASGIVIENTGVIR